MAGKPVAASLRCWCRWCCGPTGVPGALPGWVALCVLPGRVALCALPGRAACGSTGRSPINFARNSPASCSNVEIASLELQRFWAVSKNDRRKLCATFSGVVIAVTLGCCGQAPPPPTGTAARPYLYPVCVTPLIPRSTTNFACNSLRASCRFVLVRDAVSLVFWNCMRNWGRARYWGEVGCWCVTFFALLDLLVAQAV